MEQRPTKAEELILANQVTIMKALSLFYVPEDRRKSHWPADNASEIERQIVSTLDFLNGTTQWR